MNSRSPADDPTSIGSILIQMSAITPHQLENAVEQQKRSTLEYLLGKLLVAEGYCTRDQLEVALFAQEGMRSRDKKRHALALAEIAKCRKRISNGANQRLIDRSVSIVRKATREDNPAITTEMLAKSNSE